MADVEIEATATLFVEMSEVPQCAQDEGQFERWVWPGEHREQLLRG